MKRGDLVIVSPGAITVKRRTARFKAVCDHTEPMARRRKLLSFQGRSEPVRSQIALNGLRKRSQVMIDKPAAVKRQHVREIIGRLDDEAMLAVTRSLAVFLGIA